MTNQQKEEIILLLQKFCSDNYSNRLNEWIAESFLNRVNRKLGEMVQADLQHAPDPRKEDG